MAQISQSDLDELLDNSKKLLALEHAGVDNWEGYDIALDEYQKGKDLIEKADNAADQIAEILSAGVYEPSERGAGFSFTDESVHEAKRIVRDLLN